MHYRKKTKDSRGFNHVDEQFNLEELLPGRVGVKGGCCRRRTSGGPGPGLSNRHFLPLDRSSEGGMHFFKSVALLKFLVNVYVLIL